MLIITSAVVLNCYVLWSSNELYATLMYKYVQLVRWHERPYTSINQSSTFDRRSASNDLLRPPISLSNSHYVRKLSIHRSILNWYCCTVVCLCFHFHRIPTVYLIYPGIAIRYVIPLGPSSAPESSSTRLACYSMLELRQSIIIELPRRYWNDSFSPERPAETQSVQPPAHPERPLVCVRVCAICLFLSSDFTARVQRYSFNKRPA